MDDDDSVSMCASLMLGNLARSDAVSVAMVHDLAIHVPVIALFSNSDSEGVVHAAGSLLQHLAVPTENKSLLGGDAVNVCVKQLFLENENLQYVSLRILRQLARGSGENSRLLIDESPSTHASVLDRMISLGQGGASQGKKVLLQAEIARIVVSLCREFKISDLDDQQEDMKTYQERLLSHVGLAEPLVAATEAKLSPLTMSEAWFGLALLSHSARGAQEIYRAIKSRTSLDTVLCSLGKTSVATPSIPEPEVDAEARAENGAKGGSKDTANALLMASLLLRHLVSVAIFIPCR